MAPNFNGVLAALITPFTDDRKQIDESRYKAHIEFLLNAGIHGLVPGGSTGEFTVLSLAERKQLTELTVKFAAGRTPVIPGVGSTRTEEAVELAVHAALVGCTAVMVVPPYYDPVNYEQLKDLLLEIHQASKLPIVYYNIPGISGLTLTPEQIAGLSSVGVFSVKDTSGNAPDFTEIAFAYEDKVQIWNGWDTLTFYGIAAGRQACIWGAANIFPELAVALWNAIAVEKDIEKGRQLWKLIFPLCKFLEGHNYSAAVKAGVELRGLETGGLRKPFRSLKPEHYAELRQLLIQAQVPVV
ncbi:dihydrodipicolinate synthase [Aspergillus niger ATCC 1015]|uniref:Dihydrodipicolinate synthase n=2 Tax=Aspergillus niger TaxID=5061 RepID=G3XQJ5_ASPNA|nr:dihydrodipicolinate synthase [Aspergillus niger ATCC 1015]KAI2993546.1 hypothetical protein CBS147345_10213 [Aspergillus niger]TPR12000.1 Histone-like transcription factor (CBF/NF-Y) and archaeal histone family protein [Aspergillus niger]GKZ97512.1 hypothetical protein AnigIFM59636_000898 [Aspergillus niger]SPB44581.1 unnamed protein product [Aspergillus niger]